ncbi:hypothetical protein G7Y89_g13247 [Cudoniella acicularis]|uniref:Uncharacterized protein n=1 Tax=Cudoniella acicularis TaxID=354080 RepID=A0A8H4RA92_9HELO|nr:hypothetical protein G7Y89_g13247 [Cudoniella acicularis]
MVESAPVSAPGRCDERAGFAQCGGLGLLRAEGGNSSAMIRQKYPPPLAVLAPRVAVVRDADAPLEEDQHLSQAWHQIELSIHREASHREKIQNTFMPANSGCPPQLRNVKRCLPLAAASCRHRNQISLLALNGKHAKCALLYYHEHKY